MFDWHNSSLTGCNSLGCWLRDNRQGTAGPCHCLPGRVDVGREPENAIQMIRIMALEIRKLRKEAADGQD